MCKTRLCRQGNTKRELICSEEDFLYPSASCRCARRSPCSRLCPRQVPHVPVSVAGRFSVLENGSLYVREVQYGDEARYGCIAGNSAGLAHREIQLIVRCE